MTLKEIRTDLRNIRYYYNRKETFDEVIEIVGENEIVKVVKMYNNAVRTAPPKLFDLYVNLYIKSSTQEKVSTKLNYTEEYIQILNKKLLLFLQKELTKIGK